MKNYATKRCVPCSSSEYVLVSWKPARKCTIKCEMRTKTLQQPEHEVRVMLSIWMQIFRMSHILSRFSNEFSRKRSVTHNCDGFCWRHESASTMATLTVAPAFVQSEFLVTIVNSEHELLQINFQTNRFAFIFHRLHLFFIQFLKMLECP